jgi:hypothetical protein
MTTTHTPFTLGSVSTGTLRAEDLLPVFAATLDSLHTHAHQFSLEVAMVLESNQEGYPEILLTHLTDALQEACPPFVFFGALSSSEPDNFGFWPDWDALDQAMFQKYGESLILDVRGEETLDTTIIQVRDNGNVTVMDMDRNVLWTTA